MKIKISPTVVGVFVLGALLLGLIALLSFGSLHLFSKPQRFVVYFDESIHGLDLGSPVKLRGVRVGRVVDLNIRYDTVTHRSTVAVVCEFSRSMIKNLKGEDVDVADRAQLDGMIEYGLRARLGVVGLATGLLFVDLDFFDPEAYPVSTPPAQAKYVVIPSVQSTIAEYQASLTEILSDLKRVDFGRLAQEVHGLITDTRKQINGLNLAALTAEWTKAGQSVTELTHSEEIKKVFADLDGSILQLKTTLLKIDAQVDPAGVKLNEALVQAQETLKSFSTAAATARNFISAQSNMGDQVTRTLEQLNDAAAAVERLADFLERNPNAIITGKRSK